MELVISLDSNSVIPLYRQIYQELRDGILSGRLEPGQRLPSTRTLAQSLAVSRTTVTQSYEQLHSEGYLETRQGSGTFVCCQLPDDLLHVQFTKTYRSDAISEYITVLSAYGMRLQNNCQLGEWVSSDVSEDVDTINFQYGSPALGYFPWKQWQKLLSDHSRRGSPELWDYTRNTLGYPPLREAIAGYLTRSRGVECSGEQILIVNGSQQALDLVTRIFVNDGDTVAIEDPGYLGARYTFLAQGATILPIRVDQAGMQVESLPPADTANLKLVYVTPSHQFPTGAVLSLPRRLQLLNWATQSGTIVIEDDYDSEFRYNSRPIPALQGLDRGNKVIYMGTFSKVMFPALRLGYLVVPKSLASVFAIAKWLSDRQCPILEQCALTDFINQGSLEQHLRRMRSLYDQRRQTLIQALEENFGDQITIIGENAGIHLMMRISTHLSDAEIVHKAAQQGVGLFSASMYYWNKANSGEFVLGYSSLSPQQICEGVQRLRRVFD